MGVLDEAIRSHLELKRRHGADPSEVAELEKEALGDGHAEDDRLLPPYAEDDGLSQPHAEDHRLSQRQPHAEDDGLHQLRAEFSRHREPDRPLAPQLHEETMEIDVPSLFSTPLEEPAKSVASRY